MSAIKRFEDLEAWKIAREVTKEVYRVSNADKLNRDFALRDQIRRAAISVLSNIAEGFERDGDKEFVQFLSVAKGSAGEVRAQLYIAFDQNYFTETEFKVIYDKVTENSRLISGLIRYLQQSELKGKKFK